MKKLVIVLSVLVMVVLVALSACSAARPLTTVPAPTQPYIPSPSVTVAPPTQPIPATTFTSPPVTTQPAPIITYTPATTTTGAYPRPPTTSATTTGTTAYPRPTTTAAPTTTMTRPPTYIPPPVTVTVPATSGPYPTPPPPTGTIGLSVGGAKDVANFRENIRNNYLPLPTDVTYEGLFYDYFFDTGQREPSNKLFSPSYSYAVTRDPISRQTEYYLSVGLNSGMKESDFRRKPLNLVVVLDNSGSMGELFTRYYYDGFGTQRDLDLEEGSGWQMRKMDSANQCIVSILDQLQGGDRLAIVTFNSDARVFKSLDSVNRTDMWRLRDQVMNIYAGGSTNLDAGLDLGTSLFHPLSTMNNFEYENRMIVLTDAQPNTGDISSSNFAATLRRNADNRIYTTVIGIGVDFNSQLIEMITKTKGANYYSVHSPRQFRQRVEDEFEYMVTPLVFNVQFDFVSRGWAIEKVFGSPEADRASGRLMTINTLFPAKSEGGENRGGIVLLKLRKTGNLPGESVILRVSYEDRNGRRDSSEQVINLESWPPESFANSGTRKGVLLTRYAALLKNWLADERQYAHISYPWNPAVREETGIIIPPEVYGTPWERQSMPLVVSEPYKRLFRDFARYFESEIAALQDADLYQELDILNFLSR